MNRVSSGGLQVRQYFHRYTDDALDLCDALASYVPTAKVKLDEISKILGLTGKPQGIDGKHASHGGFAEEGGICKEARLRSGRDFAANWGAP